MMRFIKGNIGLNLLTFARKLMRKISVRKIVIFSIDADEQKRLLNRIKEPNDLFERAYSQYICQMSQIPVWVRIALNIVSFILYPFYMIRYSDNSAYMRNDHEEKKAVFIDEGESENIIPISLKNEFSQIIVGSFNDKLILGVEEKHIIKQLRKKYMLRPYFCTKCMLKIGIYAYQIRIHSPQAIITCSENSFTVSVLTEYCRYLGIEHINVMHGEKFFNIRDSFVEFDRYYVWDQYYIDILCELRAPKEQFIVESPVNIKIYESEASEYKYEYTYYLGAESESDLLKIKKSLLKLGLPGSKLCIRYHPRYSNVKLISQIFNGFAIENPYEVPLDNSISQTKGVVSLYSTVLYQAYKGGKTVIIDDVTDPKKYIQLRELKYIMINKPHIRLSEIINC